MHALWRQDFVRLPGEKFSFEVATSCQIAADLLHCDVACAEAVPVSIDAHEAFRGASGVNAQILQLGCICARNISTLEPRLLSLELVLVMLVPRFWISIVELCCAKKVFEWNSLEAGLFSIQDQADVPLTRHI